MKAVKRADGGQLQQLHVHQRTPPRWLWPTETLHPNSHTNPTPQTTHTTLLPYGLHPTYFVLYNLQPALPYFHIHSIQPTPMQSNTIALILDTPM